MEKHMKRNKPTSKGQQRTKAKPLPEDTRLLPSDYYRQGKSHKKHYRGVDDTPKEPTIMNNGFFTFPEEVVGNKHIGMRPFLVFYFDAQEDYETVLSAFKVKGSKARSHPELNSTALADMVRKQRG
jgi:hypothetical protein